MLVAVVAAVLVAMPPYLSKYSLARSMSA